jgi:hypothetical protein
MSNTTEAQSPLPIHIAESGKAAFMDLLYQRSGRKNGVYTGLWESFCLEAGEVTRSNFTQAQYITCITAQDQIGLDPNAP